MSTHFVAPGRHGSLRESGFDGEIQRDFVDRDLFWRRQFLNPFAFEGAPEALSALVE
jgi:hypothetical protein